jgi:hypothetical protein
MLMPFSLFDEPEQEQTEMVHLNLLEVFVPKVLYQADLDIERAEVIQNSIWSIYRNAQGVARLKKK